MTITTAPIQIWPYDFFRLLEDVCTQTKAFLKKQVSSDHSYAITLATFPSLIYVRILFYAEGVMTVKGKTTEPSKCVIFTNASSDSAALLSKILKILQKNEIMDYLFLPVQNNSLFQEKLDICLFTLLDDGKNWIRNQTATSAFNDRKPSNTKFL